MLILPLQLSPQMSVNEGPRCSNVRMSEVHEQPEWYRIAVAGSLLRLCGRHHKIQLLQEVLTSHPSSFHFSDSKSFGMWFRGEKWEDFKAPRMDLNASQTGRLSH